jgi:hypothetical protein
VSVRERPFTVLQKLVIFFVSTMLTTIGNTFLTMAATAPPAAQASFTAAPTMIQIHPLVLNPPGTFSMEIRSLNNGKETAIKVVFPGGQADFIGLKTGDVIFSLETNDEMPCAMILFKCARVVVL